MKTSCHFLSTWVLLAGSLLGCGSVATRAGVGGDAGADGIGGAGGGATADAGDAPITVGDGAADRPTDTGAGAGGRADAATGAGGATGSGGVTGSGGAGGTAPSCLGAGVCGRGPTGVYCAQSNGASGFRSWTQWSDNFSDAASWRTMAAYWATIQFPDVNGDGKADICGRGIAGILCALSTGTGGFAAPTAWSNAYSDAGGWAASPYYWATIQFPDVNGDGKADVCGRANDGVYCAVSTGVNGFGPAANWTPGQYTDAGGWSANQAYWGSIQFPDLNGDGKADVCGRAGGGIYCALSNGTSAFGTTTYWQAQYSDAAGWLGSPSYWATIAFPDLNGDGNADVCSRASGGIYCAISNGTNGFGPATYWATDFANAGGWDSNQAYWGTIQYPDVNGDRKADICGRGIGGVVCGLSNGTSGFSAPTSWAAAFNDATSMADATLWGTIQYPDLNGDGKADICGRTATGVTCGVSNGTTAFATAAWTDQYSDVNGWKTDLSYGATLQTPNLNVTGCAPVTKKSTYIQPLSHRLAPF